MMFNKVTDCAQVLPDGSLFPSTTTGSTGGDRTLHRTDGHRQRPVFGILAITPGRPGQCDHRL